MVKKILSAALILTMAVAGYAAFTSTRGELLRSTAKAMETVPAATLSASQESAAVSVERPDPGVRNTLLQRLVAGEEAVEFTSTPVIAPRYSILDAAPSMGVVVESATPRYQVAPRRAKANATPKLVKGLLISKDTSIDGTIKSYRHQLAATETEGVYTITDFWGMDSVVTAKIDLTTGEVGIAPRVIYRHSTYGDISVVPLSIGADGKLSLLNGDIKGTLGEDGSITLSPWGVMVSETTTVDGVTKPGDYYGRLFDVVSNSVLMVPNTEVSGFNVSTSQTVMYRCVIEQTEENVANFYGFNNLASSDVLSARLTAGKTMVMSPQTVFNNAMYGPFCNYPATFTYNASTEKWSVSVNARGNMVFTDKGNGELKLPGYVIAQRLSPSQTIAAGYNDLSIVTDAEINYPATPSLTLNGKGTEAEPYLIENAAQIKQLASLCDAGASSQGLHFALAGNIDLSSVSASVYNPIGTDENPFMGTFDGKGYTVTGFKVNGKGFTNTGLFGVIGKEGTVKNLNISKAFVTSTGMYLGVVAAVNFGTIDNVQVLDSKVDGDGEVCGGLVGLTQAGTINRSSYTGTVLTQATGAGISGYVINSGDNWSNITDCHAKVILTIDGYMTAYSNYEAGGIAGITMRSNIKRCYVTGVLEDQIGRHYLAGISGYASFANIHQSFNTAAIKARRTYFGSGTPGADDGDTETGGLVGYISGGELIDCFNAGTIVKNEKSTNVGGLVGYLGVGYSTTTGQPTIMINRPVIKNCLAIGQLLCSSTDGNRGLIGATFVTTSYTASHPYDDCVSNCFFDNQIMGCEYDGWSKTTAQLTAGLPEGFDSEVWAHESGKYPSLKVFAGTQAQEIAALPVVLRNGDDCNKVKVDFTVTPSTNVAWALNYDETAGESATETAALRMEGNRVVVKDKYFNSTINASTADGWSIKLYRLAVVPKMYDGEGTETSPYLIKNVDDFKKLNEAVATYGQGHIGDFFAQTADIDFTGADFKGVGFGSTYRFNATFDGKGHKVSGIKFDAVNYNEKNEALNTSPTATGLFGVVGEKGTLKNIIIDADNDILHYGYGGAVAGVNFGTIEGCRNYSTVRGVSSYIGGIAGTNFVKGRIINCYNAGNVYFGISTVGGIVGYNASGCVVSGCQNDGDVIRKSQNVSTDNTLANTVGGIVGSNYGKVDRALNNGTVSAFDKLGGIAGYTSSYEGEGDVTMCVNNGIVTPMQSTLNRGGIIGQVSGETKIENNYYDASLNVNGGAGNTDLPGTKGVSTSELLVASAPEGLPADDFDFQAEAYPTLKAYASEPAAAKLRKMYVAFQPKQLRTNVTSNVALAKAEGLMYSLKDSTAYSIANDTLIAATTEGMKLASDSLTITYGNFVKEFAINTVPAILTGDGTKASPYIIKDKNDWNSLADFVESSKWEYPGNFFRLANDINFEGDSIRLLAVNGVTFQGEIDGAGHSMTNFVYENLNATTKLTGPNLYKGQYIGLVGTLGNTGAIRNLTVGGSLKGYSYLAGVVAKNYGTIEDVTYNGTLDNVKSNYAGGVVLYNYAGGVIRNCTFSGLIKPAYASASYIAGIATYNYENTVLENCVNNGEINASGSVCGIAYEARGIVSKCVNNGKLYAKNGIVAGVVYKLDANAGMDNCYNTAEISLADVKKNSIYGVFGTTVARTATSDPERGYIRNCYNTGNLTGGSDIFGLGKEVLSGWTISDCYNTGDVVSVYNNAGVTTSGNVQGLLNKVGGATTPDLLAVIERCYNTGDVKGNYGGIAGLVGEMANISLMRDCYNLGNVHNTTTSGLTTGGLTAKLNGSIERSFNAGDVYSKGNAVGGIFGYMASGKVDVTNEIFCPASVANSFNLGNVTVEYTGTGTQGDAGGLGGYFSTIAHDDYPHSMINCYNAGNVTSNSRVGGIAGGAFRPQSIARNCYNSGKIICKNADSEGRYYWSGTTFTNSYTMTVNGEAVFMLAGHSNCYYDAELNPGSEFRSVPNSRKKHSEMASLELGDAYTSLGQGLPVLKDFAETDAAAASSAMLLFADTDTYDNVASEVTLVGKAGTEWSAIDPETGATSTLLEVKDGKARPVGTGKVLLVASYNGFAKNYTLSVTASSSLDETLADKEVKEVIIYDLNGRQVSAPTAGNTYIVRTHYTDGTVKARKLRAL